MNRLLSLLCFFVYVCVGVLGGLSLDRCGIVLVDGEILNSKGCSVGSGLGRSSHLELILTIPLAISKKLLLRSPFGTAWLSLPWSIRSTLPTVCSGWTSTDVVVFAIYRMISMILICVYVVLLVVLYCICIVSVVFLDTIVGACLYLLPFGL